MRKQSGVVLTGYVVGGLVLMLVLSIAGNAWLFHERDKILTKEAATEQLATDTKAAATACSSSVDTLKKDGDTRQANLISAIRGIAPAVGRLQAESLAALQARPDDPKDLCGSLQRYWARQIKLENGGKP